MKKNVLKNNKGITLLALVVTIVVLIILAGVAIRTINGGIIENTNKATGKYNSKATEENDTLSGYTNELNKYAGENTDNPPAPDKPTKEPTNEEYFSWTTTDTEATITGFSDAGKEKYNAGEIKELVIPSEYNRLIVTEIGNSAFSKCVGLTEIVIPDSVTKINNWGFYGCTGIKELNLPKSVVELGHNAFSACDGLTEIKIHKELKSADAPFEDCKNLIKVTFEDGSEKIPATIMSGCKTIKEIIIPKGVTEIGNSAFSKCVGLTEIVIPDSVTKINNWGFYGCTGIKELNLPKSVVELGHNAFSACDGLTEIKIHKELKSADAPFEDCKNLIKVTFEDGSEKIPATIMSGCKTIKEIIIPKGVTEIGNSAFSNCVGLTEIVIPDSITKIGNWTFYNCTNLTNVNFYGTEAQWNAISIGSSNDPLTSATKQFNQ